MTHTEPVAELAAEFSSPDATALPWATGKAVLEAAEVFWLSTVRPDGRPHVTPLIAVWVEEALVFCTGAHERKAKNLAANTACVLTTGCNSLAEGLDVVVEGTAERVVDPGLLGRVAAAYELKYGADWHFEVVDDTLRGDEGNVAIVFMVEPATVFGFGKGNPFAQTVWRFPAPAAQRSKR